jgi:hypothetical protein
MKMTWMRLVLACVCGFGVGESGVGDDAGGGEDGGGWTFCP